MGSEMCIRDSSINFNLLIDLSSLTLDFVSCIVLIKFFLSLCKSKEFNINEYQNFLLIYNSWDSYLYVRFVFLLSILHNSSKIFHELFFGANLNLFTGVVFLGIGNELSPNFLGIADLNSLFPSIPVDLSLMGIYSKNFDENGYDLFIRASRTISTG